MEIERLKYLRDTVIPHIEGMPVIEDWLDENNQRKANGAIGEYAVLNFGWYCELDRATGKPVSERYDCGMEACLAGWYKLLGQRDKVVGKGELEEFSPYELADHFGLLHCVVLDLFGSTGDGAERDSTSDTKEILAIRKKYLDELIAGAERVTIT